MINFLLQKASSGYNDTVHTYKESHYQYWQWIPQGTAKLVLTEPFSLRCNLCESLPKTPLTSALELIRRCLSCTEEVGRDCRMTKPVSSPRRETLSEGSQPYLGRLQVNLKTERNQRLEYLSNYLCMMCTLICLYMYICRFMTWFLSQGGGKM